MKKSPKQLSTKLFYRYTILLVCIVLALVVYFISTTKARILETNFRYMEMMTSKAEEYLNNNIQAVNYIHANLYQTSGAMEDLLNYFKCSEEEYQQYRLDTYMSSASLSYEGFDSFLEKMMQAYPEISTIELISYEKSQLTICYPDGKVLVSNEADQRLKEAESGNLVRDGEFYFQKEIRNPDTMAGEGCIIIGFDSMDFAAIQDYYSIAELLVYHRMDTPVYHSAPDFPWEDYFQARKSGTEERFLNAYENKTEVSDYVIYAYLPKALASRMPVSLFLTILGVGILIFLIGEYCVRAYLQRLNGRLNGIIEGMHQITTGDLSVRLASESNGDELDVIAENFNQMCTELERYIQKSYLAEIEQKNAELEALQNQINPHFLYNTLEAIRMKAICNGDREVGKMLYSMSVIFRSQLKEANMIPVIQEIHYCKKYMELFEYRYQGKFTFSVECPEELMRYYVMKFILQPVIENYFIHGIRAEQEGNSIRVWVERVNDALIMHVVDNGRGMERKELESKNKQLREKIPGDKKSVGIDNVNRRIRAVYGDAYGVTLQQGEFGGLHVIVTVGIREEKDEKAVQPGEEERA